jgi:hypothetical protein
MNEVMIFKKYSFIEYIGETILLENLESEALDNLDKIFGIDSDNDHLIEFSPNGKYNSLTSFEASKKYLIVANSNDPYFVLYSYQE